MLVRQDVMDGIDALPTGKPMRASSIRHRLKREGIDIEVQSLVRHLERHPRVFVADTRYHRHYYEVRP